MIPNKDIIKEVIERYIEETRKDNFDLLYKTEDGINTTVLADSIQYDMKFDKKYAVTP